jgi:hypothetical protein
MVQMGCQLIGDILQNEKEEQTLGASLCIVVW